LTRILILSVLLLPAALGLPARPDITTATAAASGTETVRTVYFTALDGKGTPVPDLTAADLTVKENGKDRVIATLRQATAPLHVAILVDDAGTGGFRSAVAQFLQKASGRGTFAISLLSPQPIKVADFTTDVDTLNGAINRLGPRGRIVPDTEQIIEAVREAANALQERRGRRAIVVLTVAGEKAASDLADDALGALKRSGAVLSVLSITGADAGRVLGDGPRQSGGTVQQVSGQVPLGGVLAQIADNLLYQYALTYTLPDGVKPGDKLSLSTSRKGVTLLAPSRIPDK
jgi:VWFA-related protein